MAFFYADSAKAKDPEPLLIRQSRIIMGTAVEILISPAESPQAHLAMEQAFKEIERIDRLMSNYRADSEVSELGRHAGKKTVLVSQDTLKVIERALYFSHISGGSFDITIAPVFQLWAFKQKKIPAAEELAKALKKVGYQKIKIFGKSSSIFLTEPRMAIDLGAIAKGYAVDQAWAVLSKSGIKNFLVNIGGDLRAQGQKAEGALLDCGH